MKNAAPSGATHETLWRPDDGPQASDRKFGFTLAAVLGFLGAVALLRGQARGAWELGAAAVFLLAAWLRPSALAAPNRGWTWLGRVLNGVVSPILIVGLFYLVVTPVGLAMRAFGGDPLRRRRDPDAPSYWQDTPAKTPTTSMTRQF